MLSYCKRCIMPNTKPDLYFDEEGVCSACLSFLERSEIDWDKRFGELTDIISKYRSKDFSNWDCIVPVSGGKDSTYQVIKMLEFGIKPLCVTAKTCDFTTLGEKNLLNLVDLGVDLVQYYPNPIVRAKLNRIGLEQVGDISWPEHVAIFSLPVRAAVQFNVPLIIWGENSQNEYGGPAAAAENNVLDKSWLDEFGGLLGLRVSDVMDFGNFNANDLISYTYPTESELQNVGVTGIFLGHYIPWDGAENAKIAVNNGFSVYSKEVEGSVVNYENLDNYQTGIHDYFKFLKFGFGRATDQICLDIRRGKLTREAGIEKVRAFEGFFPWSYLGKSLEDILEQIDLSLEDFTTVCDRFTNKRIFKVDEDGALVKDNKGNLTKINYDNP